MTILRNGEGDPAIKMNIGNWRNHKIAMMEIFGKDLTPHRVKHGTLKR